MRRFRVFDGSSDDGHHHSMSYVLITYFIANSIPEHHALGTNALDDITESDYLSTLLRDSNASHVLETVVSRCPADAFNVIWKTYFESRLARLTIHPVANFVVAKALERVSEGQLSKALEELEGSWKRLISLFLEKLFIQNLLTFSDQKQHGPAH